MWYTVIDKRAGVISPFGINNAYASKKRKKESQL